MNNPNVKLNSLELPHQKVGTDFLTSRKEAAIFDEQGLGKSKQIIDAITSDVKTNVLEGALIVCPNGLKKNWGDEIERFSSLSYAIFGSGKFARRKTFLRLTSEFFIINYEAVASELPSLKELLRFKKMALILDESHRIKSPDAKVTEALFELKSDAEKRYIMSGTPVANKPEDLWSQFYFLNDGESLGESFSDFRQQFCKPGGGYQSIDELRNLISDISIRRLKEDAVDLPEKKFNRLAVLLHGKQLEMYNELRQELEIWVRDMTGEQVLTNAEEILVRLLRLAQLASNPRLIDTSYTESPIKFQILDDLLQNYLQQEDQKVLIWTAFVENVKSLEHRFAKFQPSKLYGEMSDVERNSSIERFKHDKSTRLLIANPAVAREGLTLTEANVAIYLDRTFNLVDYLQSQDRIHRISQTRPCEIVLLLAQNTIDEFIDFCLEQKFRLAKYVQTDSDIITPEDLNLEKPAILQALLSPDDTEN